VANSGRVDCKHRQWEGREASPICSRACAQCGHEICANEADRGAGRSTAEIELATHGGGGGSAT
jgi:hypothetical protein